MTCLAPSVDEEGDRGLSTTVAIMKRAVVKQPETTWITIEQAAGVAPVIRPQLLRHLVREHRGPEARRLTDGELIFDELLFRRWLEGTVSPEWVHGNFGDRGRATPNDARLYAYQDASLERLRRRLYIPEAEVTQRYDWLPKWRLRLMRQTAIGPRYLKPSSRTVLYVEEEVQWWAAQVPDHVRPDRHEWERDPRTFDRVHPFTPSDRDLSV